MRKKVTYKYYEDKSLVEKEDYTIIYSKTWDKKEIFDFIQSIVKYAYNREITEVVKIEKFPGKNWRLDEKILGMDG